MLKQIFLSLLAVVVIGFTPFPASAQTPDLSDALARMNSIISEMEKLRAEFTALTSSVSQTSNTPTPTVLGIQTSSVFTESLEYGETNNDIKKIQQLLATDPEIYPYGVASGFFGPKTEEAINNLQVRNGWDPVGIVGPATKVLLEGYFKAYPDGNYPDGVLDSKPPVTATPQVQGASTDVSAQLAEALQSLAEVQSAQGSSGNNPAKEINVEFDSGEALIEI